MLCYLSRFGDLLITKRLSYIESLAPNIFRMVVFLKLRFIQNVLMHGGAFYKPGMLLTKELFEGSEMVRKLMCGSTGGCLILHTVELIPLEMPRWWSEFAICSFLIQEYGIPIN